MHTPSLDAMRGIAILLVLAFHTNRIVPGGDLGVDLFFVLSGFLITSLLITEFDRDGRISMAGFYRRRAFRLLPALVAMLFAYVVVVILTSDGVHDQLVAAAFGATYTVDLAQGLGGPLEAEGLRHLWSLGVEEQFYLLWPPVLVYLLSRHISPRSVCIGLLAVAALSSGIRLLGNGFPYGPHEHADGVLVGCAAGVALSYGVVPAWIPRLWPLGLLAMFALVAGVEVPGIGLSLFVMATAVVIVALVTRPEARLARAVNRRWLRWFGMISYGLYIWHWPIFAGMTWAGGWPVALLAAILSYRLIEQPFLRRRHGAPAETSSVAPVAP
jgi:peptidoglycan/LPS O-acetylase OafA/YrhL